MLQLGERVASSFNHSAASGAAPEGFGEYLASSLRVFLASSGRPSHQGSRAWPNRLLAFSAATEDSVAHDRNFMSSGEPKIALSDVPTEFKS